MSRYKASLIHLLISAVLVGSVVGVVYWFWYPEPTFEVVGIMQIVLLLVTVDLIVGPLLTLIVYKHGKPGMRFDLTVIALIQVIALAYGTYRMYEEKPHYLVFVVDRLEFVSQKGLDRSQLDVEENKAPRFVNLVQVFAQVPQDTAEYQRYMDSIMTEGKPDLERRPEYWQTWNSGAASIREKIKPLDTVKPGDPNAISELQQASERFGGTHDNLGVLPIGGIEDDVGMLIDYDTLEVLDVLKVNPWIGAD